MQNTQAKQSRQPEQQATDTLEVHIRGNAADASEQSSNHLHDVQVDAHTIRAREAERSALRADIEAFLNSGGKVTSIAPNLRTDNPRKPQNNYGKGSL